MAEELRVDPVLLRAAGRRLQRVAGDMASLIAQLDIASAAYDGVWGKDRYGAEIAEGKNGYLASRANVVEVGRSRSDLTDEYGTGLVDAADTFQQVEEGNAEIFR